MSNTRRTVLDAVDRCAEACRRSYLRPAGIRRRPPWRVHAHAHEHELVSAVAGRVVLVTGASSGIGQQLALRLGAAGAHVLLVARRIERLDETLERIEAAGGAGEVHGCDLADADDVDRLAKEVLDRHSSVDILVNNAGRSIRRPVMLTQDRFHDFERTMQLNYFGSLRLTMALLPSMRRRRAGHIVNVSTGAVLMRMPEFSAYVASKAAMEAFSDCAATELRHHRVHFTTVHMPLVRTPDVAQMDIWKPFPALTVDEAAELLCQAIVWRPKRIGTRAERAAAWARQVCPATSEKLFSIGYRVARLRPAARRPTPPPAGQGVGPARPG